MRSACVALLLALFAARCAAAADPNALWHIVGEQCVPNEREYGLPKPCVEVDLAGGYAVLKDIVGETQFLLIPTTRVAGIESPEILAADAPNYWQAAWQARRYVEERAHRSLPRDAISLAINAMIARSQDQLHIHVDCVRLDVTAALRQHASAVGPHWAPLPMKLQGSDYLAMRIDQPELTKTNPFVLLADGVPGARRDMAYYTLVVMGDPTGFVLLAGHAGTGNRGHGEDLQDHACAAAR